MPHPRLKRWSLIVVAFVAVLAVTGIAAMHFAAQSLKNSIEQALGPESRIADLSVGLTSVEISGISVKAPKGWPTGTALRAERVVVVPDLRQLISGHIEVRSITFEKAYLSAVRPKEGGGLKILPSMLDQSKKKEKHEEPDNWRSRGATISQVRLKDCTVEFYDSTTAGSQKMRIDAVNGTIDHVEVPKLTGKTKLDLKGTIKGINHLGTIAVKGWIDVASKNSEVDLQVRNVDLALFEPYLVKIAKAGVDQGTFNLDVKSTVHDNVLYASGTLTLTGLQLKTGKNVFSGFSNIPRRAILSALEDDEDKVTLHFELKGDLDNPAFSLSESIAMRTGAALIKGLGLSFEGLIRALLIILKGFGGAFGAILGG